VAVQVRPYRPGDLDALYDICLQTGEHGGDASALYADPRLIGEIYAAPYAMLEPELAFVAEDAAGVAAYVIGTADTRAFEARCEAQWWPQLRARHPDTADVAASNRTRDQWSAYQIHHPLIIPQAVVDVAPAHLHIDLLPRLQGQGLGKTMLDTWLAAAGGRAHLACSAENHRALRFYDRYGFRRLQGIGPQSVVWMAIGA
jgi:GNAT superfamily N-acetyltransferase